MWMNNGMSNFKVWTTYYSFVLATTMFCVCRNALPRSNTHLCGRIVKLKYLSMLWRLFDMTEGEGELAAHPIISKGSPALGVVFRCLYNEWSNCNNQGTTRSIRTNGTFAHEPGWLLVTCNVCNRKRTSSSRSRAWMAETNWKDSILLLEAIRDRQEIWGTYLNFFFVKEKKLLRLMRGRFPRVCNSCHIETLLT